MIASTVPIFFSYHGFWKHLATTVNRAVVALEPIRAAKLRTVRCERASRGALIRRERRSNRTTDTTGAARQAGPHPGVRAFALHIVEMDMEI